MIKLELTVEEVNFTLAALSKQPFEQVAALIEKVRSQAIPQVQAEQPAPAEVTE